MRMSDRILLALSDAPMSTDALMHELEATRLSIAIACGQLRKGRRIALDDRKLWHLLPWSRPTSDVDPIDELESAAEPDPAPAPVVAPAASVRSADPARVLAVLLAAGLVSRDQVAAAEQLVR